MKKEDTARHKSKKFAIRIINLSEHLKETQREFVLSQQILRSGTSIGANLAESETAISERDFMSKVYIDLKECGETLYWLELLHETGKITPKEFESLYADCEELKRMLQATTRTLIKKQNAQKE